MEPEQDSTGQSPFETADAAHGTPGETADPASATAQSTDPDPTVASGTPSGQTPATGTDPTDSGNSADTGVAAVAEPEGPAQSAPTATEADGTTAAATESMARGQAPAGEPAMAGAGPESADATTTVAGDADDSADTEPPTQEDFGAFGPGASLMFHAPDPDEIRRAAEAHAARLRELAQEREAECGARNGNHEQDEDHDETGGTSGKRRRRRRGDEDMELVDESDGSVTRVRTPRGASEGTSSDEVTGVKGSTRLEAKRQRRRESRQSGRRRHVITEAEFLARRESVERTMLVRQKEDRIQIGVLEDGILAEHFVSHTTQDSLIGNVYVGKVQNVLPSMEAAFVDIGRGRNAVLYAGEVDWDASELGNKPRKIENALRSGDTVLVQVTKDPVGHKGARLTSQVSLPGRYLVYVPGGSMTGISRKLPDVERQRLKKILKDRLPEGAGVIVRTAAEGASETELTNDINRLRSQWEQIQEKARSNKTLAPELLYAEPDLTIKTVRDVFNEDFTAMVVQGEQAWDNIEAYVTYVAPDLLDRLQRWTEDEDLFEHMRVAEQIQKALERKVFLPSGGSLVIDRTEAMTVVDVNTGKFTGSGGNLEETVTKNNLEAAEEIVRQLRLRDIGGIIVVDFIDMVLESNRDLVLRRLVECLGRDRTKHQVAEVTSLGLVQMTRKRMGTGLLEVFSEPCEECAGRGVVVHDHPLKGRSTAAPQDHRGNRTERKRSRQKQHEQPKDKPRSGSGEGSGDQQAREEATRTAFANIAAASGHEDDAAQDGPGNGTADAAKGRDASGQQPGQGPDHSSDGGQGDSEAGRRRKKRRGKRSRGRGQQGEDNASQQEPSPQDAADRDGTDSASRLTIGGEVVELPLGQREGQDRRTAEESLTLDSLSAAFSGEDTTPTGSTTGSGTDDGSRRSGSGRQRRGRRVATAPGTVEQRADSATRDTAGRDGTGTRDASRHESPAQQDPAADRGAAGATRDADPARGTDPGTSSGARDTGTSAPAARSTAARTGTGQPGQETPARRRRGSRRAVAPTAAPGTATVEKREYSAAEATASRFTATATPVTSAASDHGPTVVGVGVSARDITMTPKSD